MAGVYCSASNSHLTLNVDWTWKFRISELYGQKFPSSYGNSAHKKPGHQRGLTGKTCNDGSGVNASTGFTVKKVHMGQY